MPGVGVQDKLNFYESMAILAVGTSFLLGLGWLTGFYNSAEEFTEASVGSFAFFTAAAYVAGFLLQGPAAFLAEFYWKLWGGQPTDWVLQGAGRLLGKELEAQILVTTSTTAGGDVKKWQSTVSMIAGKARAQPENRLERFLGNYGLARGIAASTIFLLAFQLATMGLPVNVTTLFLSLVLTLALMRMHRSGKDYAKEVFHAYLRSLEQKTAG